MAENDNGAGDVARKTREGRHEATPFLAIGTVALTIAAVVAVVLAIAFAVYFLA